MTISFRAAAGAIVGLILLAGCSAPAAPSVSAPPTVAGSASAPANSGTGDQSVSDACTALGASLQEAASTMQSAMSEIGKDPSKAVTALETFQSALEQAVGKVSNPQVRAQADKALAATKKFVAAAKAAADDPSKAAGFTSTVTEFQSEMGKVGEVCSGS